MMHSAGSRPRQDLVHCKLHCSLYEPLTVVVLLSIPGVNIAASGAFRLTRNE